MTANLGKFTEGNNAPDLRKSVRDALDAMTWLTPTDDALKSLALRQAAEIEKAVDRADQWDEVYAELSAMEPTTEIVRALKRLDKLQAMCDLTKTVGWLGPQLQGVLRDLGGTPAARAAMKADKPVGSRLAQLRDSASPGQHDS
jgi:hypothetical protein